MPSGPAAPQTGRLRGPGPYQDRPDLPVGGASVQRLPRRVRPAVRVAGAERRFAGKKGLSCISPTERLHVPVGDGRD